MKRFLSLSLAFLFVFSFLNLFPSGSIQAATTDVIFEAENGTNGNGTTIDNSTNASGNKSVGSLHLSNAYNQISNVNGGQAGGKYYLTIRYATGDTQATKALYVNGVKTMDLVFKNTGGWNTFVNQTVEVTLNAGTSNTIRIQESGGGTFTYGAELDKYTLSPKVFKVTGYIHPISYIHNDMTASAFDSITDVVSIGFHTLDTSGNIITRTDDPNLANWPQYFSTLDQLIGTKSVRKWVTLSANATIMSQVFANSTSRAKYITNVLNFLNQYNYDGVDIDWEYPSTSTDWNNFSTGLIELQQKLGKNGKSISVALAPWGVNLSANAFASVEQINSMVYDLGYYHATFEHAVNGMNYFTGLGVPKNKLNLGLAWYGRPTDNSSFFPDYDLLVSTASTSVTNETDLLRNQTLTDSTGAQYVKDVYFNGVDMNRRKMLLAQDNDLRGVMMWHLFADVALTNSKSLLTAIMTEKNQHQQYRNMTNLALNQWYSANVSDGTFDVYKAFDNNDTSTYWQAPAGTTSNVYLQLDFKQSTTFNTIVLKEHGNNIQSFKIQKWSGGQWVDVYTGGLMGAYKVCTFSPITSSNVRVLITSAVLPNIPSTQTSFIQYNNVGIYEVEVYNK